MCFYGKKKIKILRTENGGGNCNKQLAIFLIKRGLKHELTVPYCPQQNSMAEPRSEQNNRTIFEKVGSMLTECSSESKI